MKRYLHEKITYVQKHRAEVEHVLIVPGAKDELVSAERSRIYAIRSPLVSRAAQYRALLDLRRVDEIIGLERPDIIETSDPYQLGWEALRCGKRRGIPVVAFYHSHFPDAYFRWPGRLLGPAVGRTVTKAARAYVRNLYNQFEATLVASAGLSAVLQRWKVRNIRRARLGVNIDIFCPADDRRATRESSGIPPDSFLLLYVGRLIAEKNTALLADAFALLAQRDPRFHLLVIGDGQERQRIEDLQERCGNVSWIPYATEPLRLAAIYRAADLFVHPGTEETFGLVALESQACGTPVIGIRGTFMDEVILHDQSDWAESTAAPALADAIERMAARDDLNALGLSASKQVAEHYAWPRVFADLFSIYADVLASYRRP